MTMHEKVSGVWKEVTAAHEKVSGVWKEILEGYERVGGVWKKFYESAITVTLQADMGLDAIYHKHRTSASPTPTTDVILTINGDGTWDVTGSLGTWEAGTTFSGNWGTPTTPGAGDFYEVSFNNGSTWNTIGTSRSTSSFADDTTPNNGSVTDDSGNFVVIVRKIGTTSPTSSDTTRLIAEDEYSTA